MVNINGMAAKRVSSPRIISIEHRNSAKTTKMRENFAPKPMGSMNVISFHDNKIFNFGKPCVSMNMLKLTLKMKSHK